MSKAARLLILAVFLAGPLCAAAGKPGAATAPPKPAAELEERMGFLLGEWNIEGAVQASFLGPAHRYKGTASFKKTLGGFWIDYVRTEARTKENPMPQVAHFVIGWDPAARKLIGFSADNFGGWTEGSGSGWVGDRYQFLWAYNVAGLKIPWRDDATRTGENEFNNVVSIGGPDGQFELLLDEHGIRK